MDKKQRDIIKNNIDALVFHTNYKSLMEKCLEKEIIFPVMVQDIERKSPHQHERHKLLFTKITTRGPLAFQKLIEICKEVDEFQNCYDLLISHDVIDHQETSNNVASQDNDDSYNEISIMGQRQKQRTADQSCKVISSATDGCGQSKNVEKREKLFLKEFTDEVQLEEKIEIKKSTKFYTHDRLSVYPMTSKNRGVLFLVNNIEFKNLPRRNGAEIDRDKLISLFREMGFKIFYYEDITASEFNKLIRELINSSYLSSCDCFVLSLLTHGGPSTVEFVDSSELSIEGILTKFNNVHCDRLVHKPKIFLFPFCRGNKRDIGVAFGLPSPNVETDSYGLNQVKNISTCSDMLICYASTPGFTTFREKFTGSWYVECMYNIWSKNVHDTSIDVLLKLMEAEMKFRRTNNEELQTMNNEERGFDRILFFNPGLYK